MTLAPSSVLLPVLLVLIVVGFWVYAIVDFSRTDARDIRVFPQPVWVVILILGSFIGAIAWLTVGRPRRNL